MTSAEEIIYRYCEGRLFPDPNYYDGRGNSVRDLNSPLLELVHKGIAAELGTAQAAAFVNMVKNLKNTNAKSFLLELYRLERKGWRYSIPVIKMAVDKPAAGKREAAPADDGAQKRPLSRRTEVLNAFTKSGSVFGHDDAITGDFLKAHKAEIVRSSFAGSYDGAASD